MKFDNYNINDNIKEAIRREGYKKPTDIQFKAIPHILSGEDLLAIAQTGTGKTAAFAIPILDIVHRQNLKKRSEGIKCLVMVPTRELAIQINDVFTTFGKKLNVTNFSIFGGVDQDPQINKLNKGVDILVTTPGRMFDLVSQGHIKLNRIQILVLDEADHMLDLGFLKDIQQLIRFLPKRRQTLFISATINPKIKKLAYSLVNKPVRIQISPKDPVSKNVDHFVIYVEMDDKRFFLERLVKENPSDKMLVFVRTKVRAERVKKAMERVKISATTLHGDIEQKDRLAVLKDFTSGLSNLLIATDLSARGIDIPKINYVINYDLPDKAENYVHRVGRTGRGRSKGTAFTFCSKDEKPMLNTIQKYLDKEIKVIKIKPEDKREIVDLTDETKLTMDDIIDHLEHPQRGKRKKRSTKKKYDK
ncbi:MAG: DEAD/DEAH box helicase [Saprospiraceae bacterium]|nr:DEAD/DEAH box helicase [Saprospiraceae bacterium]